MKDPLTEEELDKWLDLVKKSFKEKYAEALTCEAISEEEAHAAPYILAMSVLHIIAKQFEPSSDSGKRLLRNLALFI